MKIFRGTGADNTVTVTGGKSKKPKTLAGGPFEWGKGSLHGASKLAIAMLNESLGEGMRAKSLAARFNWRVIKDKFQVGQDWVMNSDEIEDVLKAIEKTASDMEGARRKMEREAPRVQTGALEKDQKWTNNPELVANPPLKPKE